MKHVQQVDEARIECWSILAGRHRVLLQHPRLPGQAGVGEVRARRSIPRVIHLELVSDPPSVPAAADAAVPDGVPSQIVFAPAILTSR